MSGMVMLMAEGAQEEDITQKPQISLFVHSHVRHTHFSQVVCSMNNSNGCNQLTTSEQTFTLARAGDLVTNLHLRFVLPGIANFVKVKRTHDGQVNGAPIDAGVGGASVEVSHWHYGFEWDPVRRCLVSVSNDGLAGVQNAAAADVDFSVLQGYRFQLVEKAAERKRMQVEALCNGDQSLTAAGPEPYYAYNVGYALADCITHCIGTQQISRSYGQWMHMWKEISDARSNSSDNSMYKDGSQAEYGGPIEACAESSFCTSVANRKRLSKTKRVVYVPTTFGLARTATTSLPIVGCHFNNVNISLRSAKLTDVVMNYGPELESRSGVAKNWIETNNGLSATTMNGSEVFDPQVETLVIDPVNVGSSSFSSSSSAKYSYPFQTLKANKAASWEPLKQSDAEVNLMANMIHLASAERSHFSDASMERLIVQTQRHTVPVKGTAERTASATFHHPCWQVSAIVTAAPDSAQPNREPLDGRGAADTVNMLRRPAIKDFQVYFNNAQHLPSSDHCELADYNEANMLNKMFRGAAAPNANGGLAVHFCTDAMRAHTQPNGHVNLTRVDDLCFQLTVDPVLVNGLRDTAEREHKKCSDSDDTVIAKSIKNETQLRVAYYASSYNLLRLRKGMCGAKWAL